jgi:hypothetical protein
MRPADGQRGVPIAPAITATFSEPVNPATLATSAFVLRISGGAVVPGRVVAGAGNRSASYLPNANLAPLTAYEIELTSAITDVTGNALLPVSTAFTTLDDAVATFDASQVKVSFPDAQGIATVTAPAGVFEPASFVTVQNVTTGIVVTGDVENDGSFSIPVRAAITDELHIRVLSSDEREVVIEKTEYVAADGSVAIGRKGGRVTEGEFTLDVPEGATRTATILKLTPVDPAGLEALPLPLAAGGKGSAVELDVNGSALEREADLSFPIPAAAPADADFSILRAIEIGGETLYETIDSGSIRDGKVTTDSFPFDGVTVAGTYALMWYPRSRSPRSRLSGHHRHRAGDGRGAHQPRHPAARGSPGERNAIESAPTISKWSSRTPAEHATSDS